MDVADGFPTRAVVRQKREMAKRRPCGPKGGLTGPNPASNLECFDRLGRDRKEQQKRLLPGKEEA
jgi:hypothetical protein